MSHSTATGAYRSAGQHHVLVEQANIAWAPDQQPIPTLNEVHYEASVSSTPGVPMRELIRSNDPVLISFATSLLTDAGIQHTVTDTHMNVIDGSIGAVSPRILVPSNQFDEPRLLLEQAGVQ